MKRKTGQDRSITSQWRPATQAVRGGTARSEWGETSEALFLTSGYAYDCAGDAAARFAGDQAGMTYSRLQNPTVEMLEHRIALMEGAEAARCQASGMAAMTAALLCQLQSGDHVVAGRALFGSCRWLTDTLLPKFGIATTIVDGRDVDQWQSAIRPETKVFFFETPANPTMDIIDLRAVCGLARERGIVSVVDNAFATPALQRPLEFGADVVAYSATKMMDGQGRVLAGAVCGTEDFILNALLPFTRNTGPVLSAFNAWVVLKGLETLDLRIRRQSENALKVGKFIESRVPRVLHPGLPSHPQHNLAMSQMDMAGCIFAFGVDGGRSQAHGLLDALELIDISNNIGDSRSLMTHPASTTHSGLSEEVRLAMGIDEGMLRINVGLEDPHDVIGDLDQALTRGRTVKAFFPYAETTRGIVVRVAVNFLPEQSDPAKGRWFWAYHIRIENEGPMAAQLMTRHWVIADGRGAKSIVQGDGVVGDQPVIVPGAAYDYVSGCPLTTATGSMQGSYGMIGEDGSSFDVAIPKFALTAPVTAR